MRYRYNHYIPRYEDGTPSANGVYSIDPQQLNSSNQISLPGDKLYYGVTALPQFNQFAANIATNPQYNTTSLAASATRSLTPPTAQTAASSLVVPKADPAAGMKKAPTVQTAPPEKASNSNTGIKGAGMAGGAANLANSAIGAITDSIKGAKNGQKATVGGALSKAGSLAAAGAAFGPWGAAAGAAAGLILGSMGTKGKVDRSTGEVSEPSGWLGIGRDKAALYKKGNAIQNANLAEQFGLQYALLAAQEQQQNDFTMAAYGNPGIDTTLAYLDDGELVRTPDGQISQIPELGKPTDSNLMNVPTGTQVLSDKLRVPGTKFTFAELGAKLMKKSKPKYNDKRAQTSVQLNQQNNQKVYNQLLQLLEQLKKQQYPQKQQNIPAYDDGTPAVQKPNVTPFTGYNPVIKEGGTWGKTILPWFSNYFKGLDKSKYADFVNQFNAMQDRHYALSQLSESPYASSEVGQYQKDWNNLGGNAAIWDAVNAGNIIGAKNATSKDRAETNGVDNVFGAITRTLRHGGIGYDAMQQWIPIMKDSGYEAYVDEKTGYVKFKPLQQGLQEVVGKPAEVPVAPQTAPQDPELPKQPEVPEIPQDPEYELQRKPDWMTIGTNLATLGTAMGQYANIPKPKHYSPALWTPQYGPTNYDIDPLLAQTAITDNINRYNIANVNPNTGANVAFALQSGINRDDQIARLYSQKFNNEMQMKQHNAGIYNQWAPDIANRWERAADVNAKRQDNYYTQRSKALANVASIVQQMNRDRLQRNNATAELQAALPKMTSNMPLSYVRNVFTPLGYRVKELNR